MWIKPLSRDECCWPLGYEGNRTKSTNGLVAQVTSLRIPSCPILPSQSHGLGGGWQAILQPESLSQRRVRLAEPSVAVDLSVCLCYYKLNRINQRFFSQLETIVAKKTTLPNSRFTMVHLVSDVQQIPVWIIDRCLGPPGRPSWPAWLFEDLAASPALASACC